jgi:uncharacterized protein
MMRAGRGVIRVKAGAAMGKAEFSSEPSMEELLATIRKAITDDVVQSPPAPGRQGEILELRNKVAGKLERPDFNGMREPGQPAASGETRGQRQNGFAGLLGGEQELPPLPVYHRPEPAPVFRPSYAEEPPPRMWQPELPRSLPPPAYRTAYESPVMSPEPAIQANAAFNQLAESLMARAMGDRSIEHMTQDLLRAMLKQWLDDHLPAMVERLVREEIERVARRGPLR